MIFLILFLMLLNGFFAMAEIAIISSRKSKLKEMGETGNERAVTAYELAKKPGIFLSSIQISITLIGILSGAFSESGIIEQFSHLLIPLPYIGKFGPQIAFFITVTAVTYCSIIIGELIPKRLALHNPEKIASLIAFPMQTIASIMNPIVRFLTFSTDTFFKIFGIKTSTDIPITEEEVRVLVREGTKAGIFNKTEKELVEHALHLDDIRVQTLMKERDQIVWFDISCLQKKPQDYLNKYSHSRILFCDKHLDKISGVIHVKDLLQLYLQGKAIDAGKDLKEPHFITSHMRVLKVLELFRHSPMHIAMIINEFGKVEGLITFQDILQALVGDIETKEIYNDPKIVTRPDGSMLIDGMVSTHLLKDILQIDELPKEHSGIFKSLGGFIISYFDKIPATGNTFEWGNYRFEVVDMDKHRVDKVLITPLIKKPTL